MTAPPCLNCGQPAALRAHGRGPYLKRCRACLDRAKGDKRKPTRPCSGCGKNTTRDNGICKNCANQQPSAQIPSLPQDAELPCLNDDRFTSEHRDDHLAVRHLCGLCPAASFAACHQIAQADRTAHGTYAGRPYRLLIGRPRKEAS